MKKFFTAVPLQQSPAGLDAIRYQAVGNGRLQMEAATSFPILTAVNGYVQPGEDFRLISVRLDNEAARRNQAALSRQTAQLCAAKGIVCSRGVETVEADADQRVSAHVETFQKLLDYADDDDELFCCMTFGTKPLSQAMMLAVQYAYRVKRNVSISCVVYGEVDRSGPKPWRSGKVYDMTALIQLDEIVHMLAGQKVSNPKEMLDRILSL